MKTMSTFIFSLVFSFATVSLINAAESPNDNVWGAETNGVSAGLFNLNANLAERRAEFEIWLRSGRKETWSYIVPDLPFRFDLTVIDEKGELVPRTDRGKDIGQSLPETAERTNTIEGPAKVSRIFLKPNKPEMLLHQNFNLFDYFQITESGKYRVEFEQRLQVVSTNNLLEGLVLPKVVTYVDIK